MKLNKIALTLALTATAVTVAHAAPTGSAYDRIQDARVSAIDHDLNGAKLGVVVVNDKVDAAVAAQVGVDARQDALIDTAGSKADAALAGVATNGQSIIDLKNQAGTFATKPELANGLAGKVDNADFVADQVRQDKALTDGLAGKADQTALDQSIKDQAQTDRAQDKLTAQLHADVDGKIKTEAQTRAAADTAHDTALADHDSRLLKNADDVKTLDTQVNRNQRAGDARDASQDADLVAEGAKRDGQFVTLSSGVSAAQATGDYAHSRIDAANQNIEANRQALVNTNKRVAQNTADIANHEQRITTLESQTNAKFGDLKNEIDDNKKEANAGIAGVAAMASIPQVTDKQDFSVGAGVGNRDGENAMAIGFSGRITDSVVTKVAVAADTQSGWTVGAGVSYGW